MEQNPCPECQKKTDRTPDERRLLLNRLSRIEGQIRGLRGMVERDCYCIDILTQASAAGAALDAFNRELMMRHLRTCVSDSLRRGDDTVIDELLDTMRRLMK